MLVCKALHSTPSGLHLVPLVRLLDDAKRGPPMGLVFSEKIEGPGRVLDEERVLATKVVRHIDPHLPKQSA